MNKVIASAGLTVLSLTQGELVGTGDEQLIAVARKPMETKLGEPPEVANPYKLVPEVRASRIEESCGEITASKAIAQVFSSTYDRLCGVSLVLATYGRIVTGKGIFHLKEYHSGEDIFTVEFELSTVGNNRVRYFFFPPIADSKGRTFYFELECPYSNPGNAITAWKTSHSTSDSGQFMENHTISTGALVYTLFYSIDGSFPYPR